MSAKQFFVPLYPILAVAVVTMVGCSHDQKSPKRIVNDPPASDTTGSPVTIDFEQPVLSTGGRSIVDPYVDSASSISFSVYFGNDGGAGWSDAVVGLVYNSYTSACVDPSDRNQVMGTGRSDREDGSIGLAGFPIKIVLPAPLLRSVSMAVEIHTGYQATARLRFFDESDRLLNTITAVVSTDRGTCGYPGSHRGSEVLTSDAPEGTKYAVVDVPWSLNNNMGWVFVIDNFVLGCE